MQLITSRVIPVIPLVFVLCCTTAATAEIKLTPGIGLREEYNSNIFFDPSRSRQTRDRITTVSPEVKLTGRTERLDTLLQSRFDILKYNDTEEFDDTDQNHHGRLKYHFSERWYASADAGYIRDSRADRDTETTGLVLGTARRDRQRYAWSMDYALCEKARTNISYAYDREDFPDPDFTDSTTQYAAINLSYDLSTLLPHLVARSSLGYTFYDFQSMQATNYSVTAGADMRLNETLSVSANIGRNVLRSDIETPFLFIPLEERSTDRGTVGRLALSYTGERTVGSLSFHRDIQALSGSPGTARHTSVHLVVSQRFTFRLEGVFSMEYHLNEAQEGRLALEETDERTLLVQPRLLYSFTDDLFLEASYRTVRFKDRETDTRAIQDLYFLRFVWSYPISR